MTQCVQVENTSDVTIDYLTVAFVEDSIDDGQSKAQSAEDVYEKDVFNYSLRSFWLEKVFSEHETLLETNYNLFADCSPIIQGKVERVLLSLKPKERITIQVGIFGKKHCTAGSLVIEYGCISADASEAPFFYSRQLRVSFDLTVQAVLKTKNIDFFDHRPEIKTNRSRHISRGFSDQELLFDPVMDRELDLEEDDMKDHAYYFTFDIQNEGSLSFEIIWDTYDGIFFVKMIFR
jgi:hypothetical protein